MEDIHSNAEEIGKRIRIARKKQYLSSSEIREKTGIAPSTLSDIERGIKTPSITVLLKLSQLLNCTTDWILTGQTLSEQEEQLLEDYRTLSESDQIEIIEIIHLKQRLKIQTKKDTTS